MLYIFFLSQHQGIHQQTEFTVFWLLAIFWVTSGHRPLLTKKICEEDVAAYLGGEILVEDQVQIFLPRQR